MSGGAESDDGQALHASEPQTQLNELESFANVVGLDLDDPADREHAESMMNADESDEESEAEQQEDLEAVPDSGPEFDTDGEQISSFTLTYSS